MNHKIIFTLLFFIFFSCKDNSESSSLNELSSFHEKIFQDCEKSKKSIIVDKNLILGFKFGMNKKQVLKTVDSLVNLGVFSKQQKRVELKNVKRNLYSITRYSLVLNKVSQNKIDIEKTIPLMITFENDELNSIGFYLALDRSSVVPIIKDFINKNYGDYKYYDQNNETYYWFKNNIRINLIDAGWFPTCRIIDSKNLQGFNINYLEYSDEEVRKFLSQ